MYLLVRFKMTKCVRSYVISRVIGSGPNTANYIAKIFNKLHLGQVLSVEFIPSSRAVHITVEMCQDNIVSTNFHKRITEHGVAYVVFNDPKRWEIKPRQTFAMRRAAAAPPPRALPRAPPSCPNGCKCQVCHYADLYGSPPPPPPPVVQSCICGCGGYEKDCFYQSPLFSDMVDWSIWNSNTIVPSAPMPPMPPMPWVDNYQSMEDDFRFLDIDF